MKNVKTIKVRGGYIQIDLGNPDKLARWGELIEQAGIRADKVAAGADERKETPELRSDLGKAFDMTFGRGASEKTFGTEAPSIGQMEKFFDKFIPLANKWLGGE